ncbi:RsmB/NOP family class I SAM-dependent RNA methyltransferase [Oculatella sp. FACHB-28]|uniref:RsmB/NOP family class I SAM-dependent RNA methyltransferase n=1 Tax=Oculatella sp. FACHB-28 TaxID=2692845 RepID=UPI001684E452|nr:RsmB/NOP family class I SAM-dependent RNA methyltransferase [Oculatella sp. FACHB-28]MBD2055059.1 RsmB/NOP family class I SAM-dependent RNA methyltransferase [Oculatella sp. FACHB-28]
MEKPSNLLLKFSRRLFSDLSEQERFIEALMQPQPDYSCILWCRDRTEVPFAIAPPLSWQPTFVDRLSATEKPGKHPLHEQGYYYCLDFSSVFAASSLLAIPQVETQLGTQPIQLVIDMCAAPGGKSLFALRTLQPESLISNEVIGKRIGALVSNLKRCPVSGAFSQHTAEKLVISLDSKILAEKIPKTADVVIVDAPCTGQSLLAKGEKAPGCFHPVNINKNANRQKRILANSAQLVAPQGYLAYMTCAYSPEENEQVSEWLLQKFPQFQPITISHLQNFQSHLSELPCYRMFPQAGLGAGAFTVLFQNTEIGEKQTISSDFLEQFKRYRMS